MHGRFLSLAALLLLLASVGCNRQPKGPEPPGMPTVDVSIPVVGPVTEYEDLTGRTVAPATVDLRARVSGYLVKDLRVGGKEGKEVKKGDLLFEIDSRPYKLEVERTAAALKQSQAHYARVYRDYQRAKELLPTRAISQEDYDKVYGDLAEADGADKVAEAAAKTAALNLEFTEVRAPFDGLVSQQIVDPGALVKADDTLLTRIVSLDPMYAYFDVDERTTMRVRRMILDGQVESSRVKPMPVLVGLVDEVDEKGNPLFPHAGSITFVDNQIDPGSGTLRLRGEFSNLPRKAGSRLFSPGMFVRVRTPIGKPRDSLLVAERALKLDQGQTFVYVVNDKPDDSGKVQSVVEYRRVKTGSLNNGLRVISEGLKSGERVVVNGLQFIRKPGMAVTAKEIDMPVQGAPKPVESKPAQVAERGSTP